MYSSLPKVAVVGRPNVGKSTLFNRIIGRRKAIVDDFPGVTRDRQYETTQWNGKVFELIDTGGFDLTHDQLNQQIYFQIDYALQEASVILLVVDAKAGLCPGDEIFLEKLRKYNKPILLVINKVDHEQRLQNSVDFANLGLAKTFPVCAETGMGTGDLLDGIAPYLTEQVQEAESVDMKIAIIGKPNVGKSTLFNQLIGEDRSIVMDMPGTTRDPLSVCIERGSKRYEFVDTAGIRRKKQAEDKVEKVAVLKALDSIDKAHVILCMLDASEEITSQDVRVINYALAKGRAMILLLNKWDLVKNTNFKTLQEQFKNNYETLRFIPMYNISAKSSYHVADIYKWMDEVYQAYNLRIGTGDLNEFFDEITERSPHPVNSGLYINLKYMTQVAVRPPQYIVFANHPDKVLASYTRYIENRLRERWGFVGVPIRIYYKKST